MEAFNELNEINPNTNNYYTKEEIISSVENTIELLEKEVEELKSRIGTGVIDITPRGADFLFTRPIIETEYKRRLNIETKELKIKELKEAYNI